MKTKGGYFSENTKLYEIAEHWWRSQGKRIPKKNTSAYTAMYEAWHKYAFTDMRKMTGEK